jgi:hypothetical protein
VSYTRYADHAFLVLGIAAVTTWGGEWSWQSIALGAALTWLWDSAGRVSRGAP